jgi:hypothetical protein
MKNLHLPILLSKDFDDYPVDIIYHKGDAKSIGFLPKLLVVAKSNP